MENWKKFFGVVVGIVVFIGVAMVLLGTHWPEKGSTNESADKTSEIIGKATETEKTIAGDGKETATSTLSKGQKTEAETRIEVFEDAEALLEKDKKEARKTFEDFIKKNTDETIKIIQVYPGDYSLALVKTCDVDGFCQWFTVETKRDNNGKWRIKEVQRADYQDKSRTWEDKFNPRASKVIKDFFSLIRKGEKTKARSLFSEKIGTSSVSVEYLAGVNELTPFDKVEIVGGSNNEQICFMFLKRDQEGNSRKAGACAMKQADGSWNIVAF